jgi:hypothetical protein
MNWTKPTFEEICMDAEIGSYNEDRESDGEPIAAPQRYNSCALAHRGEP